eukprot:12016577-Heterocapsa_arctica.AAC.1
MIYIELTEIYIRAFRRRQPDLMRGPTLNEIRLVDRLIHTDVLTYYAKNEGSLLDGLRWFMSNEGRRHRVWDVMEGQMENFPDRGVEKPMKSLANPKAILDGGTDAAT